MQSLSSTLITAQKVGGKTIWKVVLSRGGETTRGYDASRVLRISRIEEDNSHIARVLLHNRDKALTSLNFEFYKGIVSRGYFTGVSRTAWATGTVYSKDDIRIPTSGNGYQYRCSVAGTSHATTEPTWPTDLGVTVVDEGVTWEMDGNDGDEYSIKAPLWVIGQQFLSFGGELICELMLVGIFDLMAMDMAESELNPTADDVDTIKTWMTAIANATLTPYTNYTNFTITYDSDDNVVNSFKPADYFRVGINSDRRAKFNELMAWTGVKKRVEADEKIHIFDPKTTGDYDYEYKLAVASEHTFFNKTLRNRFVNPNKVIVKSHESHSSQYSNSAISSTSNALAPKTETVIARLASNDMAGNIATARQEGYELDAETGSGEVPMNVGQELWDWVKITDSRENDSRDGNVRYISEVCGSSPPVFRMTIRFGLLSAQSIIGDPTLGMDQIDPDEIDPGIVKRAPVARITPDALAEAILENARLLNYIGTELLKLQLYVFQKLPQLQREHAIFKKLTVTEELTIPGVN